MRRPSRSDARSPGAPTLVLVPTPLERRELEARGGLGPGRGLVALCGFGPVAAAAAASARIACLAPRRVLLLGIAGTLAPHELAVGEAACFGEVAIDGLGAGEGDGALSPRELGLPQWAATDAATAAEAPSPPEGGPLFDRLALVASEERSLLVTVCSASGDARAAARRRERFPGALAEDMEAFGVALACHLARVPLGVVRGISNVAGEREVARWDIGGAMAAARARALAWLDARDPAGAPTPERP